MLTRRLLRWFTRNTAVDHPHPRPDNKAGRAEVSEPRPHPRFELLSVEDILALPDPEWLVQDVLPRHAVAQIYGDSGVGKTFVALDIALSIAAGKPWVTGDE